MPSKREPALVLTLFFLLLPSSLFAANSDAPFLPSAEFFQAFTDLPGERLAREVWRCSPLPSQPCGPVTFSQGEMEFQIEWLDRSESESEGGPFGFRVGSEELRGEAFRFSPSIQHQTFILDNARYQREEQPNEALFIETLAIQRNAATGSLTIEMENISWGKLSAERARFREDRWQIENLKSPGEGVFWKRELSADEALSGWLPPQAAFAAGQAQAKIAYYFAAPGLSLRGIFHNHGAAGLGLGFWRSGKELFGDLLLEAEGLSALHFGGRAHLGERHRDFSTAGDGLFHHFRDFRPEGVRLTEEAALLRRWRTRHFGLNLSGMNHDLNLRSRFSHEGTLSLDEGLPEHSNLEIRYSTRMELPGAAQGVFGLSHEEILDQGFRGRFSEIRLDADRTFGSPGRMFLRPLLSSRWVLGVDEAVQGARSGGGAQLDAALEGGLSFRGEPAGVLHFLSPRARLGRRTLLFNELKEWSVDGLGIDSGLMESFHFGVLLLEQRLLLGSWLLEFPLGAAYFDDGQFRDLDSVLFSTLGARKLRGSRVRLQLDGHCREKCTAWGFAGRIDAGWLPWLQTAHLIGIGDREERLDFLRGSASVGVFPRIFLSGGDFYTFSQIRVVAGYFWTRMGIITAGKGLEEFGAVLSLGRNFPLAGWGLGLDLASMPAEGAWAATVGIRTTNNGISF